MSKTKLPEFNEIVVYDPGYKTGYAVLRPCIDKNEIHITEIGEFQLWNRIDFHTARIINSELSSRTCVVYEDFIPRTLAAVMISLQVIGVIEFLCQKKHIHCFKQQPIERLVAEKWIPQIKFDFPESEKGKHTDYSSAVRHGIVFCVKHYFQPINKMPKLIYDLPKLKSNFLKD